MQRLNPNQSQKLDRAGSAIAARETLIATLDTLYGIDPEWHARDFNRRSATGGLRRPGVARLVFFAFAMQCMSTIAVVRRETNSWKWPALQFAYMTVLAYAAAFLAFHLFSV